MSNKLGDYLLAAGSLFLNTTREAVWQHEDETVQKEHYNSLSLMIAALYDAKVNDDEIIRLVQKYYPDITASDAREMLRIEKTIEHPCRELQFYLMRKEAYSLDEAVVFIREHGTVDLLAENRNLWKLQPQELLKKIEQMN